MATKYAVASGAWSNTATWSDTDGGGGGAAVPADGDNVVVSAAVNLLMNVDLSAMTGLGTVIIRGGATPGMLYFKDGTSGFLRVRTAGSISGTTATNRGRLLANSDGVWGNTGALAYADKAVIRLDGTACIFGLHLDVALYATHPTTKYVRPRLSTGSYAVTLSGATIDTTNNTINLGSTPPSSATQVAVAISSGGSLPGGLFETAIYFWYTTSGNVGYLSSVQNANFKIDLASVGSGTMTVYQGLASSTATPWTVLEDISGEAHWDTTTDHNRMLLVDLISGGATADCQQVNLTGKTSSSVSVSASTDSAQYPGARLYFVSRNVSIRQTQVSVSSQIIFDYTSATHGGVFDCEICNTAGNTCAYGYGIYRGQGHTISGIIWGLNYAMQAVNYMQWTGTPMAITATLLYCAYGVVAGYTGLVNFGGVMGGVGYGMSLLEYPSIFSGEIFGSPIGFGNCVGISFTGLMWGCSSGFYQGGYHTVEASGVLRSVYNGFYGGRGCTVRGTISGSLQAGLFAVAAAVVTGSVEYCTVSYWGHDNLIVGRVVGYCVFQVFGRFDADCAKLVLRGVTMPASYSLGAYRNQVNVNDQYGKFGVFCEDYNGVVGQSYRFAQHGDVIKNTTIVRSGGASSSLEVVPLSNCGPTAPIRVFEWTETEVPATSQTRRVYVKGEGWSAWPAASELWLEAEYLSDDGTIPFTRGLAKSTQVLTDNTTWTGLEVTFTPHIESIVRYRVFLAKYASAVKVYVDNQLVTP